MRSPWMNSRAIASVSSQFASRCRGLSWLTDTSQQSHCSERFIENPRKYKPEILNGIDVAHLGFEMPSLAPDRYWFGAALPRTTSSLCADKTWPTPNQFWDILYSDKNWTFVNDWNFQLIKLLSRSFWLRSAVSIRVEIAALNEGKSA